MKVEKLSTTMRQMWESMDNHGHRKEIREAEINGEGADERMSSTLSRKNNVLCSTP